MNFTQRSFRVDLSDADVIEALAIAAAVPVEAPRRANLFGEPDTRSQPVAATTFTTEAKPRGPEPPSTLSHAEILNQKLEFEEAREAKRGRRTTYSCSIAGQKAAILLALFDAKSDRDWKGLIFKTLLERLRSKTENVMSDLNALIADGYVKKEKMRTKLGKEMTVYQIKGIPYLDQTYSLRELAAHPDNIHKHSYEAIRKRLKKGYTPRLAILRPNHERRKNCQPDCQPD